MFPQSGASNGSSDVVCGAIQAVLAHPSSANVCLAGAVNGGVWRTDSCTADSPTWTPLTDEEESLSVGDMVFDRLDLTGNTVLVAVGRRSSFSLIGGEAIGFLYTQNALAANTNWNVLDNSGGAVNFRNAKVLFNSVFVRGNLMMATAYQADPQFCSSIGVFRSTDGGFSWANVLQGVGRAIASDPVDPTRFYATLDFTGGCSSGLLAPNGVFVSSDSGTTWTATATAPIPVPEGTLNNAKLSVSADGSRVWSALLRNGVVSSISYSDDSGSSWTIMDPVLTPEADGSDDGLNPREKPGGQGAIHFSLLASPSSRSEIYVGGDRQGLCLGTCVPNFIGATDYTGRLFRGNASVNATGAVPSPQWDHLTNSDSVAQIPGGGTALNSGPHADSRDMEFRADGYLLEGDDGGITVRSSPETNMGDWFGVCGNIQVFETQGIAYAPFLRTVLFSNQDTGSISGRLGIPGTYTSLLTADGNAPMIDYISDAQFMFLYFGTQFRLSVRAKIDKFTGITDSVVFISLPQLGSFVSVRAMNPVDATVFAVATASSSPPSVMLTRDRGSTFAIFITPLTLTITAMVWSTNESLVVAAETEVAICMLTTITLNCGVAIVGNVGIGVVVRQLAVDPMSSANLFAATTETGFLSPAVYSSTDAGVTWTDISMPGSLIDTAALGGAVAYMAKGSVSSVVAGTSNGVLVPVPDNSAANGWRLLTNGLPTVLIYEMVYEAVDDTLVVGTLGRGVWYLENASEVFSGAAGAFIQQETAIHSTSSPPFIDSASLRKKVLLGANLVIPKPAPCVIDDAVPIYTPS